MKVREARRESHGVELEMQLFTELGVVLVDPVVNDAEA
jgi:hypothetical protein